MNTQETAEAVATMLKAGQHDEVGEQFWSPDIVSIEPMEGPMAVVRGIEAVRAKSQWFYDNHDVHGFAAEGPFVQGDQFSMVFDMDLTNKATGERTNSREVALYTVADGKLVEERFFYGS